ncbi:cyclin-domain-containing protein [Aspergillus avenaceus]|uniref:Cyclin-domain-containing protein n=1 Tax=Aspergillus avenaceus TaxID=36643 RepID=A0A5N6U9T5_ASPAV|nr:cyclin-domain-containing protein [Aspergillus avenaceus]
MAASTTMNPAPVTAAHQAREALMHQLTPMYPPPKDVSCHQAKDWWPTAGGSAGVASGYRKRPGKTIVDLRPPKSSRSPHHPRFTDYGVSQTNPADLTSFKPSSEVKRLFRRWARRQTGWNSSTTTADQWIELSTFPQKSPREEKTDGGIPTPSQLQLSPEPSLTRLPWRYEFADPDQLVHLLADSLERLAFLNDITASKFLTVTRFHSNRAPPISARQYLERLNRHLKLSPVILLTMATYIRQLCGRHATFDVSSLTVHRLLISCATVASKSLSDFAWPNPYFARVGGVSKEELAVLELELLKWLSWDVAPQPEHLSECYLDLAGKDGGYVFE